MIDRNDATLALARKSLHDQPPPSRDPYLSIRQICQDLNCARSTFYRLHRDRLPMVAVSERKRVVRLSALEKYKKSLEDATT
jgi:excisionase family DNA binding protein